VCPKYSHFPPIDQLACPRCCLPSAAAKMIAAESLSASDGR